MEDMIKTVDAGSLKRHQLLCLTDRHTAIRIDHHTQSKPGKHGVSKSTLTGQDLRTGKSWQGSYPTGEKVTVVTPRRFTTTVVGTIGDVVELKDGETEHAIPSGALSAASLTHDAVREAIADGTPHTIVLTVIVPEGLYELSDLRPADS